MHVVLLEFEVVYERVGGVFVIKHIKSITNGHLGLGLLVVPVCAFERSVGLAAFEDMDKALASPLELFRLHYLTPHDRHIGWRWQNLIH